MIGRRSLLAATILATAGSAAAQPLGLGQGGAAGSGGDTAPRRPLLVQGKTTLYQRIITRPGTTLAPQPGPAGARPVPGFTVYYVYDRRGGDAGWIEVGGSDAGRTEGWIPAAKAIEWRHAMIGAFTSRAGRDPTLFLDTPLAARRLILDTDARAKVQELRQQVLAGHPGPVVAMEPDNLVDITTNFYLLPIVSAELIEREIGPAVRQLEVISAPAEPSAAPPQADPLHNFKAAMVFLIDTTVSMQPYIDATRDAITRIVRGIGDTALKENFRFGVVAYRDSLEDTPDLEYPTRVYARPDFSQPPEAVLRSIGDIQQARASSAGFDEDPIGGVRAALNEIDWSGVSGRYVVLITDAGARPATHPHSLTRMGITEIHALAKAKDVTLMAVHLRTPEGARLHDHEPAQAQYEELTRTDTAGSLYFPVPGGTAEGFRQIIGILINAVLEQVAAVTGVPIATLRLPRPAAADPGQSRQRDQMREQMRVVGEAMRLAYLGRVEQTRAPDVVRSWTADRDLGNTDIATLDVRVLLTRNQLSDLANALQTILRAGLAQRLPDNTFFTQLRNALLLAGTNPQRISQATTIGGLLGEYLEGLPYQSQLLTISEDEWRDMGRIRQRDVLNTVESRLRLYEEFQRQTNLWVDITHSGRQGEFMYPVPLEALP